MPVFHTKTIESILEPVAQQVSKLVILHEEAEDGNAMPDLAAPVRTVKMAVDNLVRVGHETIDSSKDQILKEDMPPALSRVEAASVLLLQASEFLRADPYSAPARQKLIEGSRGILQGTSALLLAFDESEVRKIVRVCKSVLEYLAILEVVETMEDLVTYVKNLSPTMMEMAKQVDRRQAELTHQVHRDILNRSMDQVKNLTPVVISSMKTYISLRSAIPNQTHYQQQDLENAKANRDFIMTKMMDEIYEIIRVLQLTTYDEEEWDADDLAVMKKSLNTIVQKLTPARDWVNSPNTIVGGSGDKALQQVFENARKIAERCTNPADRDAILKVVGDMEAMANAMSELRQMGKGNSPQAMALAKEISDNLPNLRMLTENAVVATERSGIRKPALTVEGKVEQANQWLAHPGVDDKGLGEQATRMVVAEGRSVADSCSGPQRQDLLRLCDETEILTNQLADLFGRGQGDSPQAKAIARNLTEKLHTLKAKIQEALIAQVADDFIDISTPLKNLSEAARVALGTPGREQNFEDKAKNFKDHSAKLANTANMVAMDGGCRSKKTCEAIFKTAGTVNDLTPQVVTAARVLHTDPSNAAAADFFEHVKKQWTQNMENLRALVDEAVDTPALIRTTEDGILRDTERVEEGIRTNDPPKIVQNASNIARRANRILQVAQQEAENSEDPKFVDRVNEAAEGLKNSISPMVQNAKVVSLNPRDANACTNWRKANQNIISAVGDVRDIFREEPGYDQFPPPPPDLSQLHIAEQSAAPPRPPPPPMWPAQELSEIFNRGGTPASVFGPTSPPLVVDNAPHRHIHARVPDQFADGNFTTMQPEATMRQEQRFPDQFAPPAPPPPVPPPPRDHYGYYNQGASPSYSTEPISPTSQRTGGLYPIRRGDVTPDVMMAKVFYPDGVPPRPPLPQDTTPPRPPPPETDDEEEFPVPQANQPIMMAAHALHMEAKQWSSKDNEIIGAAKRMAILMAKLSQLVRGEGGSKKDLISTAKKIAEASDEVTKLAKKLAAECTDKKMRTNLLQVCERIPTIGTQLKILSTVKATMLGAQGSEEDQEATEMLVGNAQNLMQAVKETVRAAEAASIKIRVDSGYTIRWLRRRPWYTS